MKIRTLSTGLAAMTFCFILTAQAQHARVPPSPNIGAESQTVSERLAHALTSPEAAVRRGALEEAVFFAHFNNGQLDFSATVPALLVIYREDPEESCRLAALSALHAIRNEAAMQLLYRLILDQTSKRVQLATLGSLLDHYGLTAFEGAEDLAAMAEALLEH